MGKANGFCSVLPAKSRGIISVNFIILSDRPDGIEIQRAFAIDRFLFDKDQYNDLKNFFERVSAHDADQIVLERIESNW